jgi:hypothetical protein
MTAYLQTFCDVYGAVGNLVPSYQWKTHKRLNANSLRYRSPYSVIRAERIVCYASKRVGGMLVRAVCALKPWTDKTESCFLYLEGPGWTVRAHADEAAPRTEFEVLDHVWCELPSQNGLLCRHVHSFHFWSGSAEKAARDLTLLKMFAEPLAA